MSVPAPLSGPDADSTGSMAVARPAWVSGIIIALFIALASALLPGSMPASQQVGSAFNPATTQVALSRQEGEAIAVAEPVDDHLRLSAGKGGDPVVLYSWFSPAEVAFATLGEPKRAIPAFARLWADYPASARPDLAPRAPPLQA